MAIYEIAYNLRLPMYRLLAEMPHEEILGWFNYLERRPVGYREDLRAAYLLNAQGVKKKPEELFESIAAVKKPRPGANLMADSLKRSALFSKLQGAIGGDKLDLFNENAT